MILLLIERYNAHEVQYCCKWINVQWKKKEKKKKLENKNMFKACKYIKTI